jgi:APA family basic amino acid/polyamine antiporter
MNEKNESQGGKLKRELGLTSVVFFIFGYVVGAGILIQTGVTAGETGPALWLAFIIAGIPQLINAVITCYIVSAFPVSGGAWVYSSRLTTPFFGFVIVASIILHIMGALAMLAIGFGTYFEIFFPGTGYLLAFIVLLAFYLINLIGIKIAGWIQVVLAICGDFLVIIIFIIFGLPNVDPANLVDPVGGLLPMGIFGIFYGAIILSFSYAGFQAIIEIGGEIKNPRRNIPLGLIISFFMVATVYILVSIVMTGVMNWQTLGSIEGTLVDVGALFFPPFFLNILNILILIAIGSTIHGVMLAYSRDLYAAARDHVVPSVLGKVHKRFGTPYWALTFFVVGACIFLIFQASIIDLSIITNFAMTIPGLVIAYVPIKLKKKYSDLVEKSNFKMNQKVVVGVTLFNLGWAIFSIVIMIAYSPDLVIGAAIFYVCAIVYYFIRIKYLDKKGIDIKEICKTLPDETLEI